MQSKADQIINSADQLFKTVMKFYWTYLDELEAFIEKVPENDQKTISILHEQIEDIQEAIVHDIEVFEKAAENDTEDLNKLQDQLKIDSIYAKLKQK